MLNEQLIKYHPINEREERDKEIFLKWLEISKDIYTRENVFAHITSSSLIFNKKRDKVLMIYHNIYNSWAWTGGHADGDNDMLYVATKEAKEETGLNHVTPITEEIIAIDAITVDGHIKREKYVSSHIHLNTSFILEADEEDELFIKPDENSGVRWIKIEELSNYVKEEKMMPIYKKIINKANNY